MSKASKKVVMSIVVAAVAVLVAWTLSNWSSGSWGELNLKLTSQATPAPQASRVPAKATPGPSLTYEQAIQQYGNLRIQINEKCQFTPGSLTLKKGTKVMLDNRSKETKTLNIGSETITLPGYNWRIITVTTNNPLPYDLGIDCRSAGGSTENGLLIKIQAAILKGL